MYRQTDRPFSISLFTIVDEMRKALQAKAARIPCSEIDAMTPERLMEGIVLEPSASLVEPYRSRSGPAKKDDPVKYSFAITGYDFFLFQASSTRLFQNVKVRVNPGELEVTLPTAGLTPERVTAEFNRVVDMVKENLKNALTQYTANLDGLKGHAAVCIANRKRQCDEEQQFKSGLH